MTSVIHWSTTSVKAWSNSSYTTYGSILAGAVHVDVADVHGLRVVEQVSSWIALRA